MLLFLKHNFRLVIIMVLMMVIFMQRCDKVTTIPPPSEVITIRDTIWERYDSIIYTKPILIHSKPTVDIQYLPSPDYGVLVKQYTELSSLFLTKNTYQDSIKIESFGNVIVTDTVHKNKIIDRQYKYDFKIPTISETTIVPQKKRTQIYIGGALQGNILEPINQINVGFLMKNKKDQIYGVYAGPDFNGHMNYGVQMYWKIKLKK